MNINILLSCLIFVHGEKLMPKFIFVSGASGTGKSRIGDELIAKINQKRLSVSILNLDNYYYGNDIVSKMAPEDQSNFDRPEALEQSLIIQHLADLNAGKAINRPTYNMALSDREKETCPIDSADVIIVEGLFAHLFINTLPKYQNLSCLIYTESSHINLNYQRMKERDIVERQKDEEHIKKMKKNQIGGFFTYIADAKLKADIIIENTYRPSDGKKIIPMIVKDGLKKLEEFLDQPVLSFNLNM